MKKRKKQENYNHTIVSSASGSTTSSTSSRTATIARRNDGNTAIKFLHGSTIKPSFYSLQPQIPELHGLHHLVQRWERGDPTYTENERKEVEQLFSQWQQLTIKHMYEWILEEKNGTFAEREDFLALYPRIRQRVETYYQEMEQRLAILRWDKFSLSRPLTLFYPGKMIVDAFLDRKYDAIIPPWAVVTELTFDRLIVEAWSPHKLPLYIHGECNPDEYFGWKFMVYRLTDDPLDVISWYTLWQDFFEKLTILLTRKSETADMKRQVNIINRNNDDDDTHAAAATTRRSYVFFPKNSNISIKDQKKKKNYSNHQNLRHEILVYPFLSFDKPLPLSTSETYDTCGLYLTDTAVKLFVMQLVRKYRVEFPTLTYVLTRAAKTYAQLKIVLPAITPTTPLLETTEAKKTIQAYYHNRDFVFNDHTNDKPVSEYNFIGVLLKENYKFDIIRIRSNKKSNVNVNANVAVVSSYSPTSRNVTPKLSFEKENSYLSTIPYVLKLKRSLIHPVCVAYPLLTESVRFSFNRDPLLEKIRTEWLKIHMLFLERFQSIKARLMEMTRQEGMTKEHLPLLKWAYYFAWVFRANSLYTYLRRQLGNML